MVRPKLTSAERQHSLSRRLEYQQQYHQRPEIKYKKNIHRKTRKVSKISVQRTISTKLDMFSNMFQNILSLRLFQNVRVVCWSFLQFVLHFISIFFAN